MTRSRTISYAIPFRTPIVTAAGRWAVRRGFWVVLEEEGWIGVGEAPHLGPYVLDGAGGGQRSRRRDLDAALDLARLDIQGKRTGRSVAAILGADPSPKVAVNALLLSREVEKSASEARDAVEQGFRTLKMKVAVDPPERDIERIAGVRASVGPDVRIRIDANGGWDEQTAVRVLKAVERYDIEYAEDPVTGDSRTVRSRVGIPVAVDLQNRDHARAVIDGRTADILVLKPALLGGIRVSREVACRAIEARIGVVITSVYETAVGVAGGIHLAASLPGPERAHGLATVALLEDHPVRGLDAPREGAIRTPPGPGLGIDLEEITT